MAYTRTNWVEEETPLSAQNMNNIEDGIEELQAQKVDKVSGKALSDQNYTATEKTKLAGIEAGAQVNPGNASTSEAGLMSAADKTKLDGVQAGAQVNRTYTAVTGKPTAAVSPGFGGPIIVSQVAQDANGQVSVTDRTITIPNYEVTTSARGLMSAADKQKLNSINIFSLTATGATTTIPAGGTTTINFNCATTDCELAAIQSISLADGVAICGIAKKTSSGSLVGWTVKVVNTTNRTIQVASPKITAVIIEEEIS